MIPTPTAVLHSQGVYCSTTFRGICKNCIAFSLGVDGISEEPVPIFSLGKPTICYSRFGCTTLRAGEKLIFELARLESYGVSGAESCVVGKISWRSIDTRTSFDYARFCFLDKVDLEVRHTRGGMHRKLR